MAWYLIAKGYANIEIDYRATKRVWLEARDLAKSLGQDRWVTRSNREPGLVAFLEGNPSHVAPCSMRLFFQRRPLAM